MPETEATQAGSAINAAENPLGWLDAKLDARGEPAKETPAAEPTVSEPAPSTQPDWREVVLPEDVDHGFFRGKKVGVLYESYKHAETAKQKAERRAAELERENEQYRREREAEAAARKVQAEQTKPAQGDPYADIEAKMLENPREGIAEIMERARRDAERLAEERIAAFKQENEQKTQAETYRKTAEQAYTEFAKGVELDKLDPELQKLRAEAVLVQLTNPQSRFYGDGNNLFRAEAYTDVYNTLFGAATPAIAVKPTPELPTPPGSKKPTSPAPSAPAQSPMAKEKRDAYEALAKNVGIDPDALITRMQRSGERKRG